MINFLHCLRWCCIGRDSVCRINAQVARLSAQPSLVLDCCIRVVAEIIELNISFATVKLKLNLKKKIVLTGDFHNDRYKRPVQ